jgi:hypothetical protein
MKINEKRVCLLILQKHKLESFSLPKGRKVKGKGMGTNSLNYP